jgi:enoyl-CoA hydratase
VELLRVEHRGAVAVVTLDDPARRNAISAAMASEIAAVFDDLEADREPGTGAGAASGDGPGTGAVVITGAPPAFCSGGDVGSLARLSSPDGAQERSGIAAIYEGFLRVRRSPLPTVAAVNGPAVGAGVNLALACDVRLAAASARFDCRFAQIGLHPGGGHAWMLERAAGPQTAAAMVLFGEVLDAPAAADRGLVWSVHSDGELLDAAVALAARAASVPAELRAAVKATLAEAAWHPTFDAAVAVELERQTWSFAQGWFPPR